MLNVSNKELKQPDEGLAYSLPEQIAGFIAPRIIDERYASGSRLKEVELALEFGVSRAQVREALRILETQLCLQSACRTAANWLHYLDDALWNSARVCATRSSTL